MRSRTRIIPVMAALAAALLLAGCSGGTATESVEAVPGVAGDMTVEGGAPAPAGEMATSDRAVADTATVPSADREVIRTGFMSMSVEDVPKAAFDVRTLVQKNKGLIASEDTTNSEDYTYANITAQIPAAGLDAFIAEVSRLGTVDSLNISAQDVTAQVVDLDARIKALQTSIDRLTELLAEAQRIEDLLAIETQLATRQAELDSLTAQRTYLAEQVALSTITMTLSPISEITPVDAPGFLTGLENGWAALVSVVMIAVTALGFFLPFLLIFAIVLVPVVIIIVRQTRRRHQSPAPAATTAPEATPAPAPARTPDAAAPAPTPDAAATPGAGVPPAH